MKEHALALAREAGDPGRALNRLREYLQALVLRSFHEAEAFNAVAFVGGSALRFLHGLPRFSEDLDFSLVLPEAYAGREWMARVKRDLVLAGFEAEATWNQRRTVHTGWVRLAGLLAQAGLSGHPGQKLAIKVEIDTRPPAGALLEGRIVTRHVTFFLRHHDLPSALAGKLHALITRAYTKGRDWYDLMWYLSQRPPIRPNLIFLQNALDQTQGPGKADARAWRTLLEARLAESDPRKILADVAPFLEREQEAALLQPERLMELLKDHTI